MAAVVVLPLVLLMSCANSLIYHPHSEVVAPNFPETEAVRIATEDGESLVAWYRAPQPGQPIFLFFDGNGGRPHIWGGRWRRITESGAGYDWLIAHDYQPRDIVIHGFSLGPGVAVRLAMDHPARALILEAPFTGVDDVAAAKFSPLARYLIRDGFRSRERIADVHMPVLIVHGDRDTVVPFEQGERLYALANQPKQFVRMPGSDHATLVRDGIYPHIAAFLSEHP